MDFITQFILPYIDEVLAVIGGAAVVARFTKTDKDDKIVSAVSSIANFFALRGKAK